MNRNWLILTFLASLAVNLHFHDSLVIAFLNSLSLIIALRQFKSHFTILPLFALIPLYYFAPRYLAISILELALVFLRGRFWPLWFSIIVLCVLLQGNIINLPFSFDHERLILPTTEYKLALDRQTVESLYLPFPIRRPLVVAIGTANSYFTNLFSFITIYNFSQTLLLANFVLAVVGLFSRPRKLLLFPLIAAVLIAGATKQPDKTLFLFTARSTLIYLTWLGINKLSLSPRRYLLFFIIGLVFSAYVWI